MKSHNAVKGVITRETHAREKGQTDELLGTSVQGSSGDTPLAVLSAVTSNGGGKEAHSIKQDSTPVKARSCVLLLPESHDAPGPQHGPSCIIAPTAGIMRAAAVLESHVPIMVTLMSLPPSGSITATSRVSVIYQVSATL